MKAPAFQFYTGDWLKDPQLSMCSPSTRGVWMDLLCAMHELGRCGQVTGTVEQLCRLCRCTAAEMSAALTELESTKTATTSDRNGTVTVICRRMQREYKERVLTNARVRKHRGLDDVTEEKRRSNDASSSSSSPSPSTANKDSPNGGAGAPEPEEIPKAVNVERAIWGWGVQMFKDDGMKEADARSLLGKLAGDYTKPILAQGIAITMTANPVERKDYLIKVLKGLRNGKPGNDSQQEPANIQRIRENSERFIRPRTA